MRAGRRQKTADFEDRGELDRREKLLSGLDLARESGIEIGPLDHPLIARADGNISYVDYADAAFLRHKYRDDRNVNGAAIPEIDAIWGDSTIAEALGPGRLFDYAVASHVVEHVPDLIAWLEELADVLKPGGTLRLAVPDRRFTFDFMRRDTEVSDALTAHVIRARAPTPGQLIDSCINHHLVDRQEMWAGGAMRQPRYSRVDRLAHALYSARTAMETGAYIDVHCWVFTPASFAAVMEQLVALGYLRYACARLFETERGADEFFVIMRTSDDKPACLESWRAAGDAVRAGQESDLQAALQRAVEAFQEGARQQAALMAQLEQRLTALERRTAPLSWLARQAWARVRR